MQQEKLAIVILNVCMLACCPMLIFLVICFFVVVFLFVFILFFQKNNKLKNTVGVSNGLNPDQAMRFHAQLS